MIYTPYPFRRCTKCLQEFLATPTFFYRQKTSKDGLAPWCKICVNARSANWSRNHRTERRSIANRYYQTHKEEVKERASNRDQSRRREQSRKRYAEHANQERAKRQIYRDDHRRQLNASSKRYRAKHGEQERAYQRNQQREHPEKHAVREQRRRARKSTLPASFTVQDWHNALDYFHGCCAYCGNPPSMFDVTTVLHQEHFIPVTKGGAYTPGNILPACQSCNYSKGNREPYEWIKSHFAVGRRGARRVIAQIEAYFTHVMGH